ncbi:MAG: hypothetical protein U0457_04515 [Candidatus Sericytochromatia bacterium]
MKRISFKKLFFISLSLMFLTFIFSCSGIKKDSEDKEKELYTVKIINNSIDKALIRYASDDDLNYTFKFVDKDMETKFTMNGVLSIQYSLRDYDDAKILKIKQDTLIHLKQDDIIIDDLNPNEKIKIEKKVLEKAK